MSFSREHPLHITAVAYGLAVLAVVGIASAYGWGGFGSAWAHLSPGWLVLAFAAEVLTVPAYVAAYRAVARVDGGPRLPIPLVARMVIAGFGAFSLRGGFALDKRALHAIEDDEHSAVVRVLGLGAVEWALLAPAAWVSAVALLAVGDRHVLGSLLWPWALAVPLGFALGLWLAAPSRCARIASRSSRWRQKLATGLRGVGVLRALARSGAHGWRAWIGAGLYWALDIASFYGALRFTGLHLNLGETVLGYATGYALTRRSLPLGGAGVTEVLLTFSLHWVGQPVLGALAAVVTYRAFNFVGPTPAALLVRRRIKPLIEASDVGRTPASAERRRAASVSL